MIFKKDDLIGNVFKGFYKVRDIREGRASIPASKGVYIVYRDSVEYPDFIEPGTGGFFKGINPNVHVDVLKEEWIENENVLYIGKAGGINNNGNLRSRIRLYVSFGYGANIGHKGGRYIWQLSDSRSLLIAYKIIKDEEPRDVEIKLLESFTEQHNGRLPFANLKK